MSRKRTRVSRGSAEEEGEEERENVRHNRKVESKENDQEQQQQLIPGLPDHIAQLCLSRVHPSTLFSVSPLWRRFIYSPLFPPFLSLYAILTPATHQAQAQAQQVGTPISFSCFDPISAQWAALPAPPDPPLRLLLAHPSFISRSLPVQSLSCGAARLVVVAGTTVGPGPGPLQALPRPLSFDPSARAWARGPPLQAPRRWCAAGALGGSVYVASGVGSRFSTDAARSVERWDVLSGSGWARAASLKDGRFSREAVAAVGWRGRLLLVDAAAREGAAYHPEADRWEDMPAGMLDGWRGAAAAMDEDVVYAVDPDKGVLRRYGGCGGGWEDVLEGGGLRGAQQLAGGGGRVCVVCGGGGEIKVVDVAAKPVRAWAVEPPPGFKVVAVHVLPRMVV